MLDSVAADGVEENRSLKETVKTNDFLLFSPTGFGALKILLRFLLIRVLLPVQ